MKNLIYLLLLFTTFSFGQTIEERLQALEQTVFNDAKISNAELHLRANKLKKYINQLNGRDVKILDRLDVIEDLLNITDSVITPPDTITPPQTGLKYPPKVDVNDFDWGSFNPPSNTPLHLQEMTDPKSGSIIRLFAPDGYTYFTSAYSKFGAYNADGTMIKATNSRGDLMNAVTGEVEVSNNDGPGAGKWSNLDPNLQYGVDEYVGSTFSVVNVRTQVRTRLRTFSDYSSISLGYGEGNIDNFDRYVCLIGQKGSGRYLIVYNIQEDSILSETQISASEDLDWATMSQLGEYIVLNWRGSRIEVYNNDGTNKRTLINNSQHGDVCIDQNGEDVYVEFKLGSQMGNGGTYIEMIRLRDGLIRNIFYDVGGNARGIYGGHISGRNTQRPGWAYVSESCCPANGRPSLDVFAIKLDDSNIMEDYGRTYANQISGKNSNAVFCPSRDGTQGVFNSFWNSNPTLLNQFGSNAPMFQLIYPQE